MLYRNILHFDAPNVYEIDIADFENFATNDPRINNILHGPITDTKF